MIDSMQWPSLIYESCDTYPRILSLNFLFQCAGQDADKVKITQLYEVIRNRRSSEKPNNLKRQLLAMPCEVKRKNSNES